MTTIRLTNTATRKKEAFAPLDPANVRMYVCGPTVYDRAHLGNARPVVVFDVLYRLLRHVYGAGHVTYVRNFTDVDDRINDTARARRAAGAAGTLEDLIRERADETIRWYHEDMGALGTLPPDHEPRATEHIPGMVAMIAGLIAQGHAYEVEGHVLFRVRSYAEYGRLSGRSVDDMIAGARVEVAPWKEDPMDFVLWKPSDDELPGWPSPWGRGRPGWHIECSAMAKALLGERFDIHGGGLDLQFPHHENEVAQSCCAHGGKGPGDMAQVWMHNEMLQVEGRKMSKSLGNFFTVRDLLDGNWSGGWKVPGEVIRYVFLLTHYGKPMDWRRKTVADAKKELRSWWFATEEVKGNLVLDNALVEALATDLNTSGAINRLRELYKMGEFAKLKASANFLGLLSSTEGEWFRPKVDDATRRAVEDIVQARKRARDNKDFSGSDFLRAVLEVAGVTVSDGKTTSWIPSYAGQVRGWRKLYELSDADGNRWIDRDELDVIARKRGILVDSKTERSLSGTDYITDDWTVIVRDIPDEIDIDLLALAQKAGSLL
ncbi:MAG: cysteine--tRNA ligase [Paracoccaceae bacterium]|nr:MAG: cysteine--tRNA ligase [Paracoccaceae bacterium]